MEPDFQPPTRADRFWRVLHRINAVLIFVVGAFLLALMVWDWWQYSSFTDELERDAGGYGGEGNYVGRDFVTPDGTIIAYEANEEMGYRPERGANVSLTDMTSGDSIMIAPEGSSVVAWHVLIEGEESTSDRQEIGYVAFVADDLQFDAGRFDLVVGSFSPLTRNTVAEDIRFGDVPTVHGDGSVAIIIWADDYSAEFVAINLSTGTVTQRREVPLPRVEENSLSLRDSDRIDTRRRGLGDTTAMAAPAPRSMGPRKF